MADPFLGMIITVPYNFAPQGWAFCNGQILPISQNTALFALIGTTFGGDGVATFALPDLRGRVPVSSGQGPGLSVYDLGEIGGTENVTLTTSQMPPHNHVITLNNLTATANARNTAGNSQSPAGNLPAVEAAGVTATYSNAPANATMAAGAVTVTGTATASVSGSGLPLQILSPFLTVNYCIALQGIFPSRN
jgi:microcystin-dependent protein